MHLTDIVEKGQLTLKSDGRKYYVEFSKSMGGDHSGTVTFEARTLQLAYMKLEEYLNFGA